MQLREKARDLNLFLGGVMLGILGNLLAEFIIAFSYPEGTVPQNKAMLGIIILVTVIAIEIVFVYIYTIKVL